ncbi:hypothetical protein ACTM9V_15715, partial [Oliverpabstia intestinalis]|uniref:hypothetical protein n=1 Tax=Oliverpabstia intestinalis TaxID=2606633 RepID=UPI003F88F47A
VTVVTKSAGRDSKELITRAAVRRLLILEVLAIERVHLMFTENRKMKFLHKNKPGSNLFPNHFPV